MNNGLYVIIEGGFFYTFEFGKDDTMKHSNGTYKNVLVLMLLLATPFILPALDEEPDRITILGFIDLHGSVEMGYLLRASDLVSTYSAGSIKSQNFFDYDYKPYVDLGFFLTFFDFIDIGGSIRSVFESIELITYRPLLDRYTVFIELRPMKHVSLGFLHYCEHLSVPIRDIFTRQSTPALDRSEEKVFIRLEF